jgi:exopolysaccharide production protein ExoZ
VVSIQYLRAVAALMVVVYHALRELPGPLPGLPHSLGIGGVDVFFVISGFVMTYTTALKPQSRAGFLLRRLVRIAPLYWVMTALTAALLIFAPSLLRHSVFTLPTFIKSLLFIPYAEPVTGHLTPMLKLGWTLNFELFFYVAFAVFMPLTPLRRTLAIGAVFAALIVGVMWLNPSSDILQFYGRPIALEFVLGSALACLDLQGALRPIPAAVSAFACAAGALLLVVGEERFAEHDLLASGAPAALIVLGAVAWERRRPHARKIRAFAFLGDASYAIYLGHLYAVIALRIAWQKAHLPIGSVPAVVAFVAVCLVAGAVTGSLLHVLVERPLTRRLQSRVKGVRRRHLP